MKVITFEPAETDFIFDMQVYLCVKTSKDGSSIFYRMFTSLYRKLDDLTILTKEKFVFSLDLCWYLLIPDSDCLAGEGSSISRYL